MSFISRNMLYLLALLSFIVPGRCDSCIKDVKHEETFRNSLDKLLSQVYVHILSSLCINIDHSHSSLVL